MDIGWSFKKWEEDKKLDSNQQNETHNRNEKSHDMKSHDDGLLVKDKGRSRKNS